MTRDALETLGTIHEQAEPRDAVHVAVIQVTAGHMLIPAGWVKVDDSGIARTCTASEADGIIDPFISGAVIHEGARCWMLMKPREITALRHVWNHPKFPDKEGGAYRDISVEGWTGNGTASSEGWLKDFAADHDVDYHTMMSAVANAVGEGVDYVVFGDVDVHGDIPAEFWKHYEVVTGQVVRAADAPTHFSCAC